MIPRVFLYDLHVALGFSAYTKPLTYPIRYICRIKNLDKRKNKIAVILPVPANSEFQELFRKPVFSPKNHKIGKESVFGNRFVFWEITLDGNQQAVFSQEFAIKILPRKVSTLRKWRMEDYRKTASYKLFTRAEKSIDPKAKKIINIAKDFEHRQEVMAQALDIYNFVKNKLVYGDPIEGLYSSWDSLSRSRVDCGGFSTLMVSFLRAKGIPARVVSGFLVGNSKITIMHAWVEFMLPDGVWVSADPSIGNLRDAKGTKRSGEFGFVGSDHLALSMGSDLKIKVDGREVKTPILQNPIILASLGEKSFKKESEFLCKN